MHAGQGRIFFPPDYRHAESHGLSRPGSTGFDIGLSIAKNICDRYGWSIYSTANRAQAPGSRSGWWPAQPGFPATSQRI